MTGVIYEERLFSRWSTLFLAVATVAMLWQMIRQLQAGAVADVPPWFFAAMFILFLALTINFSWLTIRITDERIVVGYGVMRERVGWQEIVDCYHDGASAFWYGGWGIRMGWYKGKFRLIYNAIGGPRVVLLRRNSRFPELVFSTKHPEAVISAVRQHLKTLAR